MTTDNLPQNFSETLKNSDLTSLTKEGLELTLDAFLDSGVMKDIPIVGTIAAAISTTKNISNLLFLKKIMAFLKGISDVPQEKRDAMISKIDNSEKYRQKVGEFLLFQLNHCDDDLKAFYLSIAFKAVINEELSYDDFIRISNIINRISVIDFDDFISRNGKYYIEDSLFIGCGLLYFYTEEPYLKRGAEFDEPELSLKGGESMIELTPLGETIIEIFKDKK